MKSICIIPARGGSKRIPRKNIKDFLGKPIIAYSIEAALDSCIFDEVMVSTDDEEIAHVAKQYGANVPFYRTKKTANNFATTADVITEVLLNYEKKGNKFDMVCCLYATAPFVTADRLKEASDILISNAFDSVFACVPFSYPIQRGLIVDKEGHIKMKWPEFKNSRSQDLPIVYHDAGQFYFATISAFQKSNGFWGENTTPIILSELEVQDLDTATDWAIAEMKYKVTRHNE